MARRNTGRRQPPDAARKAARELASPLMAAAMPNIELCGNCEAVIDGCRGVLEYSDSQIKLSTGRLIICFCGAGLCIETFSLNQAVIRGDIISMSFSS